MSIHTHSVAAIDGKPVALASFRGKVVLIVNVASQCGYTSQYAGLEALYERLSSRGFAVLGFPCNDFGAQEPGSEKEIRDFCTTTYKVTFPMMQKVKVTAGPGQSELFEFLGTRTGKLPGWKIGRAHV